MSARFRKTLPFGADCRNGKSCFRLWAPSVKTVDLVLAETDRALPMSARPGGWFELETDRAAPGTAYLFRLPDGTKVPDPAARAQRQDVHGPSLVVDPDAYDWQTPDWAGRPWHETVLYELHVGSFTPEGGFAALERRLSELKELGITAVELMPVADFPGSRNWGYDGVLPFAPDRAYGAPDDLKRLIDTAHGMGMMVFLDVVYNHFGPDGNYLHLYAKEFFTETEQTPWGAAIDFSRGEVREFFIQNALYWLEEYRFDGLRLDAVHAIRPDWRARFLAELAERVRTEITGRHVHLVLENDANQAHWMAGDFDAQWNDDYHHAAHVLLTGETTGYYEDYAEDPVALLGRALAEGFVYQGEPSAHRGGAPRGEPSLDLAPPAFVNFLQNHDQIGNRAMGERLASLTTPEALRAMTAVHLLAPQIPLLFMGEEWAAQTPFLFFCDFHDELAEAVREGRRREFAAFPEFADSQARARIPDPNAPETFTAARLPAEPGSHGAEFRSFVKTLLELRRARIAPLLAQAEGHCGQAQRWGARGLRVDWRLGGSATLSLLANLCDNAETAPTRPDAPVLFEWPDGTAAEQEMPPWSAVWYLDEL